MTTTGRKKALTMTAGTRLRDAIVEAYELTEQESALLDQTVHTLDVIEVLERVIDEEGLIVAAADGGTRIHPAVVEARQQRLALVRLLGRLGMVDDETGRFAHRRVGVSDWSTP